MEKDGKRWKKMEKDGETILINEEIIKMKTLKE